MAEIGSAQGRIPGDMDNRAAVARVVHGSGRRVYLGPLVDGEYTVTSPCQGNPENITVTGVVCGFDEVNAVPGIEKVRRCANCPRK